MVSPAFTRGRPAVAQSVPAQVRLYAHIRPSNDGSIFAPFVPGGYTWYTLPPAAGIGSGRVLTVTVFVAPPLTPSGSRSTNRAS